MGAGYRRKGNRPLAVSACCCWLDRGEARGEGTKSLRAPWALVGDGLAWPGPVGLCPDLTTRFSLEAQVLDRTERAGPKTTACSCVARAQPDTVHGDGGAATVGMLCARQPGMHVHPPEKSNPHTPQQRRPINCAQPVNMNGAYPSHLYDCFKNKK